MGKFKKISKYAPSLFQGKLDFSAARRNLSLTAEHPFESAIVRALGITLVILIAGYVYFVGASVLNIVARKEAAAETSKLQSAIAAMEAEFFALSDSVDATVASSIGLTDVPQTSYVYRPDTAVAATIGSNGI